MKLRKPKKKKKKTTKTNMKLILKKLLLTTAASIKGSSINTNSSLDKKENKLVEQFLTWNNYVLQYFIQLTSLVNFYDNVIYQCIFLCSFDGHCYHKVAGLENVFQAENKLMK